MAGGIGRLSAEAPRTVVGEATPPARGDVLHRIARLAIGVPRRMLAVAALVAVAAGIFGVPVAKSLCACGFEDASSESANAKELLTDKFDNGDVQMVIVVSAPDGANGGAARAVGTELVDDLMRSPHVTSVMSLWTAPAPERAALVSSDGRSGLIVAGIAGDENKTQEYAKELSDRLVHDRAGVSVRAGGDAMVNVEITEQSQRDLLLMESLAIPISFLVLVWVFGGALAAAVPLAVGGMAILGALAVLRGVTYFTDVSIFALNLSAAMGLALAIDYTLLIISRYRDELADGASRDDALVQTMATAGRTVLFSATIVALSMAVMVVFPMAFLKSFAYAGVGHRRVRRTGRTVRHTRSAGSTRRSAAGIGHWSTGVPDPQPAGTGRAHRRAAVLYRWTKTVMRHALPAGLAVFLLLLLLGAPFLGVKWGFPDDRVLPTNASAHQVGDEMRTEFPDDSATAVTIVVPNASGLTEAEITRYTTDLARVPDVARGVSGPGCRRQRIRDGAQHRAAVLPVLRCPARRPARSPGSRRAPSAVRWHRAGQPGQRRRHHVAVAGGARTHRGDHVRGAVPAHRQRDDPAKGVGTERAFASAQPSARWCGSFRTGTSVDSARRPPESSSPTSPSCCSASPSASRWTTRSSWSRASASSG